MKKIIAEVLCIVLALSLVGCGAQIEQSEKEPIEKQREVFDNQIQEDIDGNTSGSVKEILKVQYLPIVELQQTEPTVENANLEYSNLVEIIGERYSYNQELQVFAEYIKNNYKIELNSSWEVFVHFYDMDQTVGMVQFQYFIGTGDDEIGTNKSIIFNLNNGKVDMIFHSCLDGITDESALLSRVSSFKSKYEQEKYQLKDGEKFVSETVNYTYDYDTGDFVYCYAVFFSYDGIINNDYGTTCLIDEDGNVIKTESEPIATENAFRA